MDAYINFWKNTFNFKGRSNRTEFNMGFWPHILCIILVFTIGPMLGLPKLGFNLKTPLFEMLFDLNWQFYHLLIVVVFLIPLISLMIRRCNDLKIEGIHAVLIGFFPLFYMFYILLIAIMGQGLPEDVIWVEIIFYVILLLPIIYFFYMLCVFSFKKGSEY
ncbi:DUF805 domain-containing protein [Macrococcoides goetzii]|uniref:DUF805 domain-containing protein n=1 Tax=Macrococcoides goetzii TaxID=1891097 RepID=A0A395GA40_9STAP|nr:DUF805 domain-containing protein [Macrococcus goetzii]RAI80607.1 DUF805 domain-containing protein [Macrococcus goetzii]